MCLNCKKNGIREMWAACLGESRATELIQIYETQLELYDTKFEILKNEEQLLVAQIDTVRRQIKELKDEVVYYDVCEDTEELHSLFHPGVQQKDPPALTQLKRRLQTLETKRSGICSRRAYLRNKKDQCMEAQEQKQLPAKQSSLLFNQHHHVHMKREKRKEEDQQRKEWVDQEREKTLSRLRSFRERRHGQYILKTPQSMMSPTEGPFPSQPLSIISLGPPEGPPTIRSAPRRNKTPKKKQPQDIPVQIFAAPPPPATSPPTAPPPPPLPPAFLPPLVKASPSSEDTPMPLREKEDPPFQAKNTLKQNLGTMDEVLASLQRGQIQLKKVSSPKTASPAGDTRTTLMSAIRLGVTLKKMVPAHGEVPTSEDNELERSIKAAMMRMKKVAADSDSDDREDETQSTDWDS
ncbi:hypothetical protein F7725_026517 [Dissostichus mawsoni]|uniref:WH2 domain-containing protein n=1 Tax=Dissostichus mawsoni TaxID=36200 RepID=A0A7J5X7A3_DISMA|nr:hypothetical protein F7725_026517 [Dissostichus mawsoni]